jgi:hypothetical protein
MRCFDFAPHKRPLKLLIENLVLWCTRPFGIAQGKRFTQVFFKNLVLCLHIASVLPTYLKKRLGDLA